MTQAEPTPAGAHHAPASNAYWTPDALTAIRDALTQVRAGIARLEQHERTPRPLRFLAMHNLALAEQILADHLTDAQPPADPNAF